MTVHRISVRPLGIENFLSIIKELAATRGTTPLLLDLSHVTFFRPVLLVLLRALIDLALRGDAAREILPRRVIIEEPHAENVRQYLRTMNLYGELRGRQLDLFVEPTEPQHLPVSPLRTSDETESIAAKLRGILLRKIPSHPENPVIGSALGIALAELLENFKRHSESRGFAFVCAQYYPAHEYRDTGAHRRVRRDLIELAVADTGVGIEKSLSSVPEYAQAIQRGTNPCELATRFGITSKPVGHGGYGLWVTKRLAERNRGAFKIASGRHYFSSGAGTPRAGSVPTEWPGTLVAMRLNSREDLDVRSVYDELPALESS